MKVSHDRVRAHTAAAVLERIDESTAAQLDRCARAGGAALDRRLAELDREWNTDRVIELEAALLGLAGLALGAFAKRGFLAVPGAIACALFVHATKGPYPLLPVLRRLGVRTAREIARERYALKALRGDFHAIGDAVGDPRDDATGESARQTTTPAPTPLRVPPVRTPGAVRGLH